ncbi:hypothetical protein BOTCAL_0072g00360 [Botryotinia calthae]|uniref:Uncharacterized protein n=1 Tax=Botryotinia calthae TaxID=38488 RepID=A0A4Y8D8Z7_9HELO|nr:hypothetical protein BOTCAL_0072g00360 [Botryotinia calthae]
MAEYIMSFIQYNGSAKIKSDINISQPCGTISKRAAPRAYLDLPRANTHESLTCPATLESVEPPHRLYFSVDSITIEWPHGAYMRTA